MRDKKIESLRYLATLAVLLIHTTTRILEASQFDIKNHLLILFLNQAARFAVPLFFFISGFALASSYTSPTSWIKFAKKRLPKLIAPYLFWSFIYYYFVYKHHSLSLSASLLTGDASYQLYFIPSLILIYALFPLLYRLRSKLFRPLPLVSLGILNLFLLFRQYHGTTLPIPYPLAVATLNLYIFILGMFITGKINQLKVLIGRFRIPMLIAVLTLLYFVINQAYTGYLKTYNIKYIYSQWRPTIFLYTLTLVATLYPILPDTPTRVSRLLYPVFYVHVIFIELLWPAISTQVPTIVQFPILFASVVIFSFASAILFRKLPLISHLTG